MSNFVHLHTHSEYSPLDGLSTMDEIFEQATNDSQPAVGITDHGTVAGHPALQRASDRWDVKPVFGVEAYFFNGNRTIRPESGDKEGQKRLRNDYNHVILLAQNNEGLKNVWRASTEAERDGFYHRPRMDWDTLEKYSEGVIATTGCLRGPLAVPILEEKEDVARANLMRLLNIYGDRLYIEIHTNHLEDQLVVNHVLTDMSAQYGVPLVAVVDSHFPSANHLHAHKTWIACQTRKDVQDEGDLFAEELDLYVQTEAEVRENLSYLDASYVDEAIANTVTIADACDAKMEGSSSTPVYVRSGGHDRDAERLFEVCMENWEKLVDTGVSQEEYIARFEREFDLIRRKKFSGYFLMVRDYCNWARKNGILVGPGRGSGAASILAYLCNITAIDPVKNHLLFERFMTEGRTSLPDFDVDFPASQRDKIQGYIRERFGDEYVLRVGTQLRYRSKGIIVKLFSALASQLHADAHKDSRAVSKIIEDAEAGTAGLGLSWDELWAQAGDLLEPYKEKYPEVFEMADILHGRLNSYGKHAAALVISSEEKLTESLPLRKGEEGESMISQFEAPDLEWLGHVKFDILTLRTLDTIQETIDTIEAQKGIRIDPYTWRDEYKDEKVWNSIGEGDTLGMFQVETATGTAMAKRMKPRGIGELSDLVALVRPGPKRSGLTDLYLNRREGKEEVTYVHPILEKITQYTQGTMVFQEQVMQTAIEIAGFTSDEADVLRKVLGKKLVDKIAEQGEKFIRQAAERGIAPDITEPLWEDITEFAKYGFNKSHSWSYAVLAYWTQWLKINYPVEFYTAVLSTVDKDRIPEFVQNARRAGIPILPQDANESGKEFKITKSDEIRYGFGAIKGIGPSAVEKIVAGQPYVTFSDFEERSGANVAVKTLLARIGAFDKMPDTRNRRALVERLEREKEGLDKRCVFKDESACGTAPNMLPCTFDWSNEPIQINPRTGKQQRPKPIPKRCTIRCRNYTPPDQVEESSVEEYSDGEIRTIEQELLGVYLSSTPFDDLDTEDRIEVRENAQLLIEGTVGMFTIAGVVVKRRGHTTSKGNKMAFLGIETEAGLLEMVFFEDVLDAYGDVVLAGNFVAAEVLGTSRGLQLKTATKIY